ADAIVDFTIPQATLVFAEYASENKISHVIGTTGCDEVQDLAIARAAESTAIMKSGNMSMGVIMLSVLVERAAQALEAADWDIEVLEMHHKHKVDAPSGTALLLGNAAASGRDISLSEKSTRVRDGITGARETETIGFATLRGGSVVGDHSGMFAGQGESITLSHRAEDRSIFARGAIKAAVWSTAQKPGLYSMRDVLGLNN
ncbi:MAG: 4-hydroxy-tetrahydrodipicolinate reductase, partial [Pseudomonadota bacterium]